MVIDVLDVLCVHLYSSVTIQQFAWLTDDTVDYNVMRDTAGRCPEAVANWFDRPPQPTMKSGRTAQK